MSYTYVEGGYAATNTDGGDADGFAINGSGAIAPNFHLFGGYSNQEIEDLPTSDASTPSTSTSGASAWATTTRSRRRPTW